MIARGAGRRDTEERRARQVATSPTSVLIIAPLFPPAFRGGGPIRTLEAFVLSAPHRFQLHVLTGDHDLGEEHALPVLSGEWSRYRESDSQVFYGASRSFRGLWRAYRSSRIVSPEIVYVNSFFDFRFSIVSQILVRAGFWGRHSRCVLAPRGEFGGGALRRHSLKKRVYLAVHRLLRLQKRVIWHASSTREEADIRALWGSRAEVVVRVNDTLLPSRSLPASVGSDSGEQTAVRAIFVGRIVEHKGLDICLSALRFVSGSVALDVFGPVEDEKYHLHCQGLADALPDGITVRFRGTLAPEQVRETIADYEILFMPTAGENYGHVIAESLSASCPVMSTPFTPWNEVLENGGGWVVDREPSAWTNAIEAFTNLSTQERFAARQGAGKAYETWQARQRQPHLLELLVPDNNGQSS